jgi:hypothetical protein
VLREEEVVKNRASILVNFAEQCHTRDDLRSEHEGSGENLEFFATQETVEDIEIEKAKAMFSPEERERSRQPPSQLLLSIRTCRPTTRKIKNSEGLSQR